MVVVSLEKVYAGLHEKTVPATDVVVSLIACILSRKHAPLLTMNSVCVCITECIQ